MGELRKQLDIQEAFDGQEYQLTVASPGGIDKLANYDLAGMSEHLDFFNVMAYDYHGAWENTTNHQAALYGNQGDVYNVDYTIQQYLNAGVSAEDRGQVGLKLLPGTWGLNPVASMGDKQ